MDPATCFAYPGGMPKKRPRVGPPIECPVCGKEFLRLKEKPQQRLCSAKCRNAHNSRVSAAKRGNAQRRTGSRRTGGYVKRGGRHEHRVVAEEMLGRPLRPREIVHHVNGEKGDNRPENLVVMTQRDHMREHRVHEARW